MSKTNYRPGSMGAQEQKNARAFDYAAGFVYLLLLLAFYAFPTYMHDCVKRASVFANIMGIVLLVVSYVLILLSDEWVLPVKSEFVYWIIVFALLILALCTAAGFNFDLRGLANRP